jgi:hypothetical protein
MKGTHSTCLGSGLTCKYETRLGRLTKDKHSSLLCKGVTYGRKSFTTLATEVEFTTDEPSIQENGKTPYSQRFTTYEWGQ